MMNVSAVKKTNQYCVWLSTENTLLIKCVKEKLNFIEIPTKNNVLKKQAWLEVHGRFNTFNIRKRPLSDLQQQWNTLKDKSTKRYITYNGFKRPSAAINPQELIVKAEQVDLTDADDDMPIAEDNVNNPIENNTIEEDDNVQEILVDQTPLQTMPSTADNPLTMQLRQPRSHNRYTSRIRKTLLSNIMQQKNETYRRKQEMDEEIHRENLKTVLEERSLKLKFIEQCKQMQLDAIQEEKRIKMEMLKEEQEWKKELHMMHMKIIKDL